MTHTTFTLSPEDKAKVDHWLKTVVYPPIIERQKAEASPEDRESHQWLWDEGYPYEGAVGGGLTYEFTPTSIGLIVDVTYKTFKEEFKLELTDWDAF